MNINTMFNAYPDSIGKNLKDITLFLSSKELKEAFKSFYILPTVFNSDIDKGFSIITYDLCDTLASDDDLNNLKKIDIDLTFDFILNHLSVLSPQFQDIIKNGDNSKYRDFFIDWNKFWENKGEMTKDGYIKPFEDQFNYNNLRKNGLPILLVQFKNGMKVPYWNTFYQKIVYQKITEFDLMKITNIQFNRAKELASYINNQIELGKKPEELELNEFNVDVDLIIKYMNDNKNYLGQMDLNFNNPKVWEWYESVIKQLSGYGATIIRLDAFSRLHKEAKRENFVNEPETWEYLETLKNMAKKYNVAVLPEIHASYSKGYYKKLSSLGCMTYDYFLPGLIIDAIDNQDSNYIYLWANEIVNNKINVVNMLGCHDGIPIRDVQGLLPDKRIDGLIENLIKRGGHKKIVHGIKDEIYQMDMTYYTALDCNDKKMEIARAIQLFMPGKPQVWYMDLFAEANDESVLLTGNSVDTREVNRRPYSLKEAKELLTKPIVQKQIELLKLRNTYPAFNTESKVKINKTSQDNLSITWTYKSSKATLEVNFNTCDYKIILN